jgi:hypothetical protein
MNCPRSYMVFWIQLSTSGVQGPMSDSVEFRHLEYLVAIHEGKNFTKQQNESIAPSPQSVSRLGRSKRR